MNADETSSLYNISFLHYLKIFAFHLFWVIDVKIFDWAFNHVVTNTFAVPGACKNVSFYWWIDHIIKPEKLFTNNIPKTIHSKYCIRVLCAPVSLTVFCLLFYSTCLNVLPRGQLCELWRSAEHSFHVKSYFNVANAVSNYHQPVKQLGKLRCTGLGHTCL